MGRNDYILAAVLVGLVLLSGESVMSKDPIKSLSDEDKLMLARLLTSETSDRRAWPYILSTAKDTAESRGVSIARMLRSHRMQVLMGDSWEYVGSMEDSGGPGPLFDPSSEDEQKAAGRRWVRWASTRQKASAEAVSAVEAWAKAGMPDPAEGFHSTKFFEKPTEADAMASAGDGWHVGRWVFRRG